MISARRHTANRDRHVLRVGLHRRRSHHRHGRRFTASPVTTGAVVDACGRLRRWRLRVSPSPPPPVQNFPCMRAGAVPSPLSRHAFGIRSHEQSVTSEPSSSLLLPTTRDRVCCSRSRSLLSNTTLPSPSPPQSPDSIRHLRPIVTPAPRSCFQRADESTLPLERFTGIVRAGEREPPAASDEEHREPCQP